MTADELYGIDQLYGGNAVYYFPVIGPRGLSDARVLVFAGLAACSLIAVVSILMFQRSRQRNG